MSDLNGKMDDIIKKYLPESWYKMKAEVQCYTLALNKETDKYKKLYNLMQGDFLKEITGMYEVQNPILYEQFQVKVTECRLDTNITVRELLHCTSTDNVISILENNFDWRLCRRVKYGHGVSFATDPGYAHLQSSLHNGKIRAMIVADVIVGNTQVGNRFTVIPNEPFDTSVSNDHNVFVKYCDYDFYPKYVIYYEGHKVVSQNGHRALAF